jgi:hypothetical protein
MPGRGGGGADDVHELLEVDVALGVTLARLPDDGAGPGQLLVEIAVQHGADIERDRRQVDGRGRHEAGRHGLVAAGEQDDAVERVAVQDLDQRQVGEVAVERGGRALAGLLDRVAGELERDPAGRRDALAHPLGELHVVAVAGLRSEPVWAMPMSGLPLRSSSEVRP